MHIPKLKTYFTRSGACLGERARRGFCILAVLLSVAIPQLGAQSISFTVMSGTAGVPGDSMPAGAFIINSAASSAEWVGLINLTVTNYGGVNLTPAPTVPTFCIQLSVNINAGDSYTFQVEPLSSPLVDEGSLNATAVRDLATLYYLCYQGNTDASWTNQDATAFQLDCWKITLNPGNYIITGSSAGGTFYDDDGWNPGGTNPVGTGTSGASGGVVGLAQTWLNEVDGTSVTSGTSQPVALYSATAQNLIYPESINNSFVPFKIEAWPGAVLLGVIGFLRVQRRLKTAC